MALYSVLMEISFSLILLSTVWQRLRVFDFVSFHCSKLLVLTPWMILVSFSTTELQFQNNSLLETEISIPFCTKLMVNCLMELIFSPTLARIFSSQNSPVKNMVTLSFETLQVIFSCPSLSPSTSSIIYLETITVALRVMNMGRMYCWPRFFPFSSSEPFNSDTLWRGVRTNSSFKCSKILATLFSLSFSSISSIFMANFSSTQSSRSSADCVQISSAWFPSPVVAFLACSTLPSEVAQILLSEERVLLY